MKHQKDSAYLIAKRRTYQILDVAKANDPLSRAFDLFIIGLIVLNVLALMLATVSALNIRFGKGFRIFEIASVAIFTVEYALRIWSCTTNPRFARPVAGRFRYAFSGFLLIDLLAILPFYLTLAFPAAPILDLRFLRITRLMRIFRILKLGRYSESMQTLGRVLRKKKEELGAAVFVVFLLLVMASSLMYYAENEAQPDVFSSIPAAMWWGTATLTTVGYGDVVPKTPLGKALGMIVSILGIGLFALPAGIVGSGFISEVQSSKDSVAPRPPCEESANHDSQTGNHIEAPPPSE